MNTKRIAVIGAGTMGHGIAQTYAAAGHEVFLYSRTEKTLQRAKTLIESSLQFLFEQGLVADSVSASSRIHYTTDLMQAIKGAWYVVETVSERADIKQELYQTLDAALPENVFLSSNTSYMNIFDLMPLRRQAYTTIVHWIAPPQLLPLVEIVRGPETSEETMAQMVGFHSSCGKTPIRIEKYVPGFIINRLQSAMTQEVAYLVENGFCSKESIDLAVKTSIMPRGMLLGVVQRMDFGGLDVVANGLENKKFVSAPSPNKPHFLFDPYERGELGVKTGKGLYDYTHQDYATVIHHRDEQLLESVRLSQKFLQDPLHKKQP